MLLFAALSKPMVTTRTDLDRLALLIQRLLDAELLPDAEGAQLLMQAEAARRALAVGDAETARRHIKRLAQHARALMEMKALALTDGQAVIEAARHIAAAGLG